MPFDPAAPVVDKVSTWYASVPDASHLPRPDLEQDQGGSRMCHRQSMIVCVTDISSRMEAKRPVRKARDWIGQAGTASHATV